MSRWVTGPKLTNDKGFTPGQQRGRIQRRQWRPGIEYVDCDGARLFDIDAIDRRTDEIAEAQRCPDELVRRRRRKAAPRLLT